MSTDQSKTKPAYTGTNLPGAAVHQGSDHEARVNEALDRHQQRRLPPLVRFADDFLLFSVSQAKAKAALDFAQDQLEVLGLKIHPDKTRVIRSSPRVSFLGQTLPAPSAR